MFSDDVKRFTETVKVRCAAHFQNVAVAMHASIVEGSPNTGAPGQPVSTGNLKNSWQITFESPTAAEITTNVSYAGVIEDDLKTSFEAEGQDAPPRAPGAPPPPKSVVGGHHSVKMTRAAIQRIVDDEARKMGE